MTTRRRWQLMVVVATATLLAAGHSGFAGKFGNLFKLKPDRPQCQPHDSVSFGYFATQWQPWLGPSMASGYCPDCQPADATWSQDQLGEPIPAMPPREPAPGLDPAPIPPTPSSVPSATTSTTQQLPLPPLPDSLQFLPPVRVSGPQPYAAPLPSAPSAPTGLSPSQTSVPAGDYPAASGPDALKLSPNPLRPTRGFVQPTLYWSPAPPLNPVRLMAPEFE